MKEGFQIDALVRNFLTINHVRQFQELAAIPNKREINSYGVEDKSRKMIYQIARADLFSIQSTNMEDVKKNKNFGLLTAQRDIHREISMVTNCFASRANDIKYRKVYLDIKMPTLQPKANVQT